MKFSEFFRAILAKFGAQTTIDIWVRTRKREEYIFNLLYYAHQIFSPRAQLRLMDYHTEHTFKLPYRPGL